MAEPSRKRSKKRQFSGNHQRSWLWGHHAVTETLLTGKWPVVEIFFSQQAFDRFSDLFIVQRNKGIPCHVTDSPRLEQLSGSAEHQGLVVRLGPFPYQTMVSFEDHLKDLTSARSKPGTSNPESRASQPLVVICDRIQDAFNFGAILRCCDGASVIGVVVGEHSQAEVTPHVVRSASGAVNHIPIVKVNDLLASALRLQMNGFQLVAADANTTSTIWDADLGGAIALVIGSEATGIAPELLAICDQKRCIPMQGKVTSLNAAVATGIILYEIRRQQVARSIKT